MIKMTLLIARKEGSTFEEFKAYWQGTHLDVVNSLPEVQKYARGYVQQYNTHKSPSHTPALTHDGIAEAWFDNLDDALALTQSDNWLTRVKEDDLNFLDVSKTLMMLSEEKKYA